MGASRRFRPRRHPEDEVGILAGWARDEAAIEDAKRQTHDRLIAQMGARRTGGVGWRIYTGAPAIDTVDRFLADGDDPAWSELRRALTDEPESFLVVATAPGRRASHAC